MDKINEDFRFRYLKNYEISEIQSEIYKLEKEWLEDTQRQESFTEHKETVTYFLTDYSLKWKIGDPYAGSVRNPESYLYSLVKPIIEDLEQIHGGRVGRAMFPKLSAKKDISGHEDGGEYLSVARRNHIPIITNPDVWFNVGKGWVNMFEGECWEINNRKWHEVVNKGDKDRVHLLIDIIPNEAIGPDIVL
jgi:hypothetical protein